MSTQIDQHELTHAPAHTYACIHGHTHACTPAHMGTHMHAPQHTWTHICMHPSTHTPTQAHMDTHMGTHMHAPQYHLRMHTWVHIYMHQHTHTYACTPVHILTHAHTHLWTLMSTYVRHKFQDRSFPFPCMSPLLTSPCCVTCVPSLTGSFPSLHPTPATRGLILNYIPTVSVSILPCPVNIVQTNVCFLFLFPLCKPLHIYSRQII